MGGILGGGGGGQQQVPFNAMGSGQRGTVFAPPLQSQEAGNYRNLIDQMLNTWGSNYQMLLPQIAAAGQQQMGAANRVSGMANPLLQRSTAESNRLFGLAPQVSGMGTKLFGMVPQFEGLASQWLNPAQTSPIFQQMANQTRQGAAASNAASGVYGPYAANTTNEALKNLQLGWSAQAPQVASGLASTGANLATTGGNLATMGAGLGAQAQQQGQQALQNYLAMVGKPQQQAIQDQLGNIGNLFNLPQQVIQDILPYLQLGQAASGLSGTLGQLGYNQQQQQLGNLGGLTSSLLGAGPMGQLLWGPGGGAFGSGMGLLGGSGGGVLGGLFGGGGGLAGGIPGAAGIMDAGSGLGFGDLAGALFGIL